MQKLLNIAFNDLRRALRDRSILISWFIVPVIMTFILGISTGGTQKLVVDLFRDPSAGDYADQFVTLLREEGGERFIVCDLLATESQPTACDVKPATIATVRSVANARLQEGKSYSAIYLPANFSQTVLRDKASTDIELIGKGDLQAPGIVEEKINAVLTRMNGTIKAARVIADTAGATTDIAIFDNALQQADKLWASQPVQIVEQVNIDNPNAASGNNFSQTAPGIGSMFVMMSMLGISATFLEERNFGTLQRMMGMPIPRWQILGGKLLGRYLLGVTIFMLIILVGTVLGVYWGNWPALLILVLVFTLAVTAMGLALATIVRTEGQAQGLSLLAALTLAPIGGAWWPISIMPTWMQTLGHISPIAWVMEAFTKLLYYNGTLLDILPQLGVLLLIAVVMFGIGLLRFRYE